MNCRTPKPSKAKSEETVEGKEDTSSDLAAPETVFRATQEKVEKVETPVSVAVPEATPNVEVTQLEEASATATVIETVSETVKTEVAKEEEVVVKKEVKKKKKKGGAFEI
mgnify:FL=1